jgi:hypothetical protein
MGAQVDFSDPKVAPPRDYTFHSTRPRHAWAEPNVRMDFSWWPWDLGV